MEYLETGGIKGMSYGDRVQTSPTGGSYGDILPELVEELNAKIADWKIEVELVKRQLERQSGLSESEQKLLKLRFVDCRKWSEITVLMGYAYRHCTRLMNHAIEALVL